MHADTVALYPAGQKNKPRYYTNLREGDIEIDELVDFVHRASRHATTRRHVQQCVEELGARRGWWTTCQRAFSLDESITLDERRLVALNLSEFKSAAEKDEL